MDDKIAGNPQNDDPDSYDFNGKITSTAAIILLTVIFLVICLYLYARRVFYRDQRRQFHPRQRRTHLVFVTDQRSTTTVSLPFRGLEASVLNSLPVFVYSLENHDQVLDCAVCLSEFEEKEKGRLLPKCNHSCHVDCIDMWFHSHNTCPLCRASVQPEIPTETVISLDESGGTETGSSSCVYSSCQHHGDEMGSSSSSFYFSSSSYSSSSPYCSYSSSSASVSLGSRKKAIEMESTVSIEIPRKNESYSNLEEEYGMGSPRIQGLKTPINRFLSLKRIISRDKLSALTRSGSAPSISSATETDLERGGEEAEPLRSQEPHDDS
ncbi:hypothetical protein HHK36_023022 [Tetracentron sinense]|uniref:RING-type E3 ubiquitin transferase n=1 Tax=Tetracentron sinense TaxID=13715 RepID=A0A835D6L3_TETSI|nr:hypothetical protein HHK36_023022 [Tetracentron sinense]